MSKRTMLTSESRRASAIACTIFGLAVWVVRCVASSPFLAGRWAPASMAPSPVEELATWFAVTVVVAVAVAALVSSRPPPAYLTSLRAVILVLLLYVVTAGLPAYGGSDPAIQQRLGYLAVARWTAIACGLGALYRPSLGLPLFLYVLWFRLESEALYRFRSESADLRPVVFFGLLLVVSWILFALVARLLSHIARADTTRHEAATPFSERDVHPLVFVLLLCTAYYVANYFWSGWGKESLEGPTHAWLFENQTYALIPVSEAVGTSPIVGRGSLSVLAYEVVRRFALLFNGLTLLTEMGPILALAYFRLLALACAALVPFHLIIFVLTGIFFWKWALVDCALAVAFWRLRTVRVPPAVALIALGVVVLSPRVLPISRLAWYDTHSLNDSYLVAVTDLGTKARVPSSYFLSSSLTMAQMSFAPGMFGRMLPTGIFGTSQSYVQMRSANACALPVQESNAATRSETWERLERLVREHHAYVLAHADAAGRLAYDWYPHHIWSNPALYGAFSAMDKRRIVEYLFVTDYVCVGYDENGLSRLSLGSDSRPIHVR
jgi:hypothetical protein